MKLIWSVRARADLARIFSFNMDFSLARAEKVDARLVSRANSLTSFPRIGRRVPGTDLRILPIPDVQYILLYRIEDECVTIVRVHSTREHHEP